MKNILILIGALLLTLVAPAQTTPPLVSMDTLPPAPLQQRENTAFGPGEYLRFRLHYGIIDAGEAELTVNGSDRKIFGRDVYHVVGTGQTLGAFDWFFKVRDRYETYVDTKGIFPWLFIRNINEGGYEKHQNYTFYQHKAAVKTDEGKVYKIEPGAQDMLSSLYYARTFDFSNAQPGDVFTIPTFVDDEEFPLRIKFLKREVISTRMGKFRCLKFVPVVQKGRIFKKEEDMIVWITDDKNKLPILAKAKVLVGSIKMELVEYKNVKNPVAQLK